MIRLLLALALLLSGCAPCLTDSQCAAQYPGTFGDPVPATDSLSTLPSQD